MPGPRGMADAITLPNGKLVIIGGTEEGFSNLDYLPNSNNVPVNEPWCAFFWVMVTCTAFVP